MKRTGSDKILYHLHWELTKLPSVLRGYVEPVYVVVFIWPPLPTPKH